MRILGTREEGGKKVYIVEMTSDEVSAIDRFKLQPDLERKSMPMSPSAFGQAFKAEMVSALGKGTLPTLVTNTICRHAMLNRGSFLRNGELISFSDWAKEIIEYCDLHGVNSALHYPQGPFWGIRNLGDKGANMLVDAIREWQQREEAG